MATDRDDGLADIVHLAQQLDVDLVAGVDTLRKTRNAHEAIRADHRHDDRCTARGRRPDRSVAALAEPARDLLSLAHRLAQFPGDHGFSLQSPGRRPPPMPE